MGYLEWVEVIVDGISSGEEWVRVTERVSVGKGKEWVELREDINVVLK
jgi:hypothetical protein